MMAECNQETDLMSLLSWLCCIRLHEPWPLKCWAFLKKNKQLQSAKDWANATYNFLSN